LKLDIPGAWQKLDLSELAGMLMVIGAPDVGKTTFARYLFGQVAAEGYRVAFLDGDPGQTSLGPPTTMTVSLAGAGETGYPPKGESWRWFVGSTSPSGHMLQVLSSAARLMQAAAASITVYDTSGLVDPKLGGAALKFAKIDLLRPTLVFAIQKDEGGADLAAAAPQPQDKAGRLEPLPGCTAPRF
jgi:polynucleotide 5'-hydroxyl-kinase GRC3/NOL9